MDKTDFGFPSTPYRGVERIVRDNDQLHHTHNMHAQEKFCGWAKNTGKRLNITKLGHFKVDRRAVMMDKTCWASKNLGSWAYLYEYELK